MSNELSTIDSTCTQVSTNFTPQVPSTIKADDSDYASLARGSTFLGRLQLFTKGAAVNKRLIGPGEYGIPENDESVVNLGDTVDIVPMARRPKALDMSDTDAIVANYDPNSDVFKDIVKRSEVQNSGCMYGVSFLVWVPAAKRFLEFFMGTKTSRSEAGKLFPFLPTFSAEGNTPARMAALSSRLIEKGQLSWHAPVIKPSKNTLSSIPTEKQVTDELHAFLNPKTETVEKVAEEEVASRRKR